MDFKNGKINIKAAGYNGARMVHTTSDVRKNPSFDN